MNLRDFHFEPDYNKSNTNVAEAFYLPCMMTSCRYDRISGYFGSTIYILVWGALKKFVRGGGKIRIICSPYLSEDDVSALEQGYTQKNEQTIQRSILNEIDSLFSDARLINPSKVLACLITAGHIEVKIAIPDSIHENTGARLFHDKVGIFYDAEGNSVGFRGPMNETYKGLSQDGNLESIDVFPSWEDARDSVRLERAKQYFYNLWSNTEDGVTIYEFPEAAKRVLIEKKKDCDWEELTDEICTQIILKEKWRADKRPGAKVPRPHQIEALEAWEKNGRKGIFEHATGSGKTYTAICAIRDALFRNQVALVLVPSLDLLSQWRDEISLNITDVEINFLICGSNFEVWKKPGMLTAWTRPPCPGMHNIVLATMDTACQDAFLKKIVPGEHLLLVADEVHRLGSSVHQNVFQLQTGARLGLSATPVRYGDEAGTQAIFNYFGGIIPPPFTLQNAIESKVLTEYFYYPQSISLTEEEQQQWVNISKEISRALGRLSSTDSFDCAIANPRVKMLLISRSRIVKQAANKTNLALEVIRQHYEQGARWIVYCDNQEQMHQVTNLLVSHKYNAYEYYADMVGDRKATLKYFEDFGGIVVSIKCLDEGVDIPSTTHALILASSRNPREFIQRRGRILRKFPGKNYAYLYDAIVLPFVNSVENQSLSIIESELARAIQFGCWARNPSCVHNLRSIAISYGIDLDKSCNLGVEDERE